MTLDLLVRLVAVSASGAACWALVFSERARWHYGLVLFTASSALGTLTGAMVPEVWTPGMALLVESLMGVFVVLSALEVGRRALGPYWRGVTVLVMEAVGAVFWVGFLVVEYVPRGDRWGYRGLIVVEVAVLVVAVLVRSAMAYYDARCDLIGLTALLWLPVYCGSQAAYLLSWEAPLWVVRVTSVVAPSVQVWVMLNLCSAGFNATRLPGERR